jgi:hypothetical protein
LIFDGCTSSFNYQPKTKSVMSRRFNLWKSRDDPRVCRHYAQRFAYAALL